MSKRSTLCLAIALSATWSASALAQEGSFKMGTFAVGGEHLSGFYHTTITASSGNISNDQTSDHIGFLGMASSSGIPAELPRLGFDGFVIDGLSLGGALLIDYTSSPSGASVSSGGVTAGSTTTVKQTTIGFAPRIGYAVMFNDTVGIWPRGGVGYHHISISPDTGNEDITLHFVNMTLEAPIIVAFTKGFALTVGPFVDIALSGGLDGSVTVNLPTGTQTLNISVDETYKAFGITVGLLGWM